jgi:glucose-1-phosphate cytidylyltransferase
VPHTVKTIILAGGQGTRLAEETDVRPKPMVEIGHRPILWHILKIYAHYGYNDFLIALGYKGEQIKRYMAEYASLATDMTVDLATGTVEAHEQEGDNEDWRVTLIDTGRHTETGGRMLRVAQHLGEGTFMMTFGDGVCDIDVNDLVAFHRAHGKLATLTAVRPPTRFGHVELDGDQVVEFSEKPQLGEGWINGGFFVLEPEVLDYIEGEDTHFQREPLENLSRDGELMAYRHATFWQCMDTLRDKLLLQQLWETDAAPWKVWSSEPVERSIPGPAAS